MAARIITAVPKHNNPVNIVRDKLVADGLLFGVMQHFLATLVT
jgi:hypothetical protein